MSPTWGLYQSDSNTFYDVIKGLDAIKDPRKSRASKLVKVWKVNVCGFLFVLSRQPSGQAASESRQDESAQSRGWYPTSNHVWGFPLSHEAEPALCCDDNKCANIRIMTLLIGFFPRFWNTRLLGCFPTAPALIKWLPLLERAGHLFTPAAQETQGHAGL